MAIVDHMTIVDEQLAECERRLEDVVEGRHEIGNLCIGMAHLLEAVKELRQLVNDPLAAEKAEYWTRHDGPFSALRNFGE